MNAASLTMKGFKAFVADGDEIRIELSSDLLHHDLTLVDIRSKFMKLAKTVSYYTENQIQTWSKNRYDTKLCDFVNLNSDAVVELTLGSKPVLVPVEFEINCKSNLRYEELIRKYYRNTSVVLVIFIAESPEIMNKVCSIEAKICNDEMPKFLYATKHSMEFTESITFENLKHNRLVLETIPCLRSG